MSGVLLLFGCVAMAPIALGLGLIRLAMRAQRLHGAHIAMSTAPSPAALGGFRLADANDGPADARGADLLVNYPRWAVILGWVLGLQLLVAGVALGANALWGLWLWFFVAP